MHDCSLNIICKLSWLRLNLGDLNSDRLSLLRNLNTFLLLLVALCVQNLELILQAVDHILLALELGLKVTLIWCDTYLQRFLASSELLDLSFEHHKVSFVKLVWLNLGFIGLYNPVSDTMAQSLDFILFRVFLLDLLVLNMLSLLPLLSVLLVHAEWLLLDLVGSCCPLLLPWLSMLSSVFIVGDSWDIDTLFEVTSVVVLWRIVWWDFSEWRGASLPLVLSLMLDSVVERARISMVLRLSVHMSVCLSIRSRVVLDSLGSISVLGIRWLPSVALSFTRASEGISLELSRSHVLVISGSLIKVLSLLLVTCNARLIINFDL